MYDLIYMGSQDDYNEVKELISKEFPEAKIEDASDDIHEYRFGVEINDDKQKDFIKFAIQIGIPQFSLTIQALMLKNSEELKQIIKEMKGDQAKKPEGDKLE